MRKMIFIFVTLLLQACASTNTAEQQMAADDNVQLGLTYLQQGNMPQAKEKLLLALQQAPAWPVSQDAMAYFLEKTGNEAEAERFYQRAINLAPDDGIALNNYGTFLCRQHQPQKAIILFLKAVTDPDYVNSAEAYENAGLCALSIPNQQQARFYFMKALQQDPGRATSTLELEELHV